MPLPIIYSFRRCPYAMRARLALVAARQTCELREVSLADKPAALLAASAKGTVPVLVLPDGTALQESLDIMHWALSHDHAHPLLPASELKMGHALALIARCDGEFKFHLDRYKYAGRFGLTDAGAHRTLALPYLLELNALLAKHGFLLGERQCLADLAIAPLVRQFAHTDRNWFASQSWPALQHWLSEFEASAAFQVVMQKYPRWLPGQPAALFPRPISAII